MEEIGLYLHFPFCVKKCAYCDFLSFPTTEDVKKIYAASLIREIRGYTAAAKDCTVTSIFLGGGTPSIMPPSQLRDIFRALLDSFQIAADAEITMEMNPGTVNEGNLSVIFDYVNRVSLGVQSFQDNELSILGRIHNAEQAERSIELLQKSGVHNLNLDLMSGIPEQTLDSWRATLKSALKFRPEHISAYSLMVEEGTQFRKLQTVGRLPLPGEETEREMYRMTGELLSAAGLDQYEFSNYAREGYRCRHNVRYWKRGDYLGFGLGAASLFQGKRWHNTRNLEHYFAHSADPGQIVCELEQLGRREEIEEFLFLGLRMRDGVLTEEFRRIFGMELYDIYGEVIREQTEKGLLTADDERIALTERGIEISNVVLAEYLLS